MGLVSAGGVACSLVLLATFGASILLRVRKQLAFPVFVVSPVARLVSLSYTYILTNGGALACRLKTRALKVKTVAAHALSFVLPRSAVTTSAPHDAIAGATT
jgi:hypothetical protein